MTFKELQNLIIDRNLNLFSKEPEDDLIFIRQYMKRYYLDYFQEVRKTLEKIDLDILNDINEILFNAVRTKKQIFTMGNGGSGATASHFVCDLNKGINLRGIGKFKAICLNDNLPTILAYANDLSYSDIFSEQLKNFLNEGDVVIGFSGSGNSINIINAIKVANEYGGITIGFSGFDGGELFRTAEVALLVPIRDIQKCEDIHLMSCHLIMQTLNSLGKIEYNG